MADLSQKTERRGSRRDSAARPYRVAGILSLLVLLTAAAALLFLPKQTYSAAEKRALAEMPPVNAENLLNGDFMSGADDYAADHFPFRDYWMRLRVNTMRLLGETESQGVYYGRDGSLIRRFRPYEEEKAADTAGAVRSFAALHDFERKIFLAVPTSVSLYPENLPAYAENASETEFIRLFTEPLRDTFKVPDTAGILERMKQDGTALYYRSDHHWTTPAAYGTFTALKEEMNWRQTELRPAVVCNDFLGSLAAKSGFTPAEKDEIILYEETDPDARIFVIHDASAVTSDSLYAPEALAGPDPYTVFLGGNEPLLTIRTTADTERTLLLFKDSYANCFLPFLTGSYKTITVVDARYYSEPVSSLFLQADYTDLMFLYNVQTLAEDESLAIVLRDVAEERP